MNEMIALLTAYMTGAGKIIHEVMIYLVILFLVKQDVCFPNYPEEFLIVYNCLIVYFRTVSIHLKLAAAPLNVQ